MAALLFFVAAALVVVSVVISDVAEDAKAVVVDDDDAVEYAILFLPDATADAEKESPMASRLSNRMRVVFDRPIVVDR